LKNFVNQTSIFRPNQLRMYHVLLAVMIGELILIRHTRNER